MNEKKVIVIGAGVAGMATAVRLAHKGFEVVVYEKNTYVGGKLSAFEKDGYFFDAGPSLFTSPNLLENLFTEVGENLNDFFQYSSLPISCTYFYNDGTIINAHTNSTLFANELESKLGERKENVLKYFASATKLYNKTGFFFLNNSLHKFKSFFSSNFLKASTGVGFKHLFKNLNQFNKSYFKNPKTVQIFNRFATYNGSNPYKAPAILSLIAHLECNDGIYYPKGGMISITNALYNLAIKKGVKFVLNTTVERIINTQQVAKGIVVDDKNIEADIVVSNMDVYFTYKKLLLQQQKAVKVLKQERSSSALIFYWGIKKEFKELGLHNILFSNNYEAEFNSIFKYKNFYDDPTIYINITSKQEDGKFAPNTCENWFVMVNVPANMGQNWDVLIAKYRAAIVAKVNHQFGVDIESLIEVEEQLNPISIESRTASFMGSLYGTSSNNKLAAFWRHPNFSSIKNLYFVGGSVHPGGGIPLCLQSAKIASDLVNV